MRRPGDRQPINDADAALMRIFELTGVKTDKELAEKLGLPPQP